jgi:hypothetical protein
LVDSTRDSAYGGLGYVSYMERDLMNAIEYFNKVHFKSVEYEICQQMLSYCLDENAKDGRFEFGGKWMDSYEIDQQLYEKMSRNNSNGDTAIEDLEPSSSEDLDEIVGDYMGKRGLINNGRNIYMDDQSDPGRSSLGPRRLDFTRSVTPQPKDVKRLTYLSSSPDVCDMELDDD